MTREQWLALKELVENNTNPLTGEFVSDDKKRENGSETIRWYQVLTQSCDPVFLRGRMEARGELNEDNDPKIRREPKP